MDNADAAGAGFVDGHLRDGFAVNFDRSLVRAVVAAEDLDERGLTGAVFTQKRVYFAGLQVKIDVLQRLHAREALADPFGTK